MKKFIALIFLLLLSGCALFSPDADDPKLRREESAAKQALRQARQWQAPNYRSEVYSQAEQRFRTVQNQHRQDPSKSIVGDYRLVQILANRATIGSLIDQLNQRKQRISNLSDELRRTEKELTKQKQQNESLRSVRKDLSRAETRISKLEDRLTSRKAALEDQEKTINQQKKNIRELTRAQEKWKREKREYNRQTSRLRQEARMLEDTATRLRERLDKRTETVAKLRTENDSIARRLNEEMESGTVRQENDQVIINLQERILFDLGEARLKIQARDTLQKIVSVLEEYDNRPIRVEGHTDDLPIKDTIKDQYPSNWELSAQRAINVTKYMVHTLGVSSNRIAAVAYGQTRPLVPNNSTENRARNRRVEIVLPPQNLPTRPKENG